MAQLELIHPWVSAHERRNQAGEKVPERHIGLWTSPDFPDTEVRWDDDLGGVRWKGSFTREFKLESLKLVKAPLVTKIAEMLRERGLTQIEAAGIVGLPQPKLSQLLRGQFRGFSERKLIECLTRLGRGVTIVVIDRARRRSKGAVSVFFKGEEPQ